MRIQILILWFKGKKVCLARKMIRQAAGSPFCDGRVTLFADPTFLHLNTLARPATVGKLGPGDTI